MVRLLAGNHLPPDILEEVITTASFVDLDESGCGYFLTLKHPMLPKDRVVCSEPLVHGRAGDLTCGFVLFLEDGHLSAAGHALAARELARWVGERQLLLPAESRR